MLFVIHVIGDYEETDAAYFGVSLREQDTGLTYCNDARGSRFCC